ncbi:acylamino-acid-releasing enzyme [Streptomyces venezuelae]|uniref:S9 family peptidase n=1 Tax=Streptomyces gardneri TaxID=66892 RepID=UPI0006BCBCB1|nr:alpha/beta fold hydrolase [Streptomyces gardneri]ALO12749.1 acylamino-acid-releasing enzyme [Streptomyces venezuelae]QPK49467.1 S9 family peptidase [Streptomyces gardneri]WRK41005.1 alpha/beta fold hydrolase [Streptomyces venezuelae]CUM36605.1 Acylamino-acid-releasing enzyme [Streptomyces venezuelae]
MTVWGAWPAKDGFACISDESGRPQPWFQTWAGERRMLPIDGAVTRLAWRPDETRLLVVTDVTGGQDYRLAELDPVTGEAEWLAAEPGVRREIGVPYSSGSQPYSPDGRLLAYATSARDVTCLDVYVRDLATGESRMVLEGDDRYVPICFSPDSRYLLVLKFHQNTDQDLYACDLATGLTRHLTPHEGPAKYQPGGWNEDGIYVCTTEGRDFLGVALLVPGRPLQWIATPDADVENVIVGPQVVWALPRDQRTVLCTPRSEVELPGFASQPFGYDGFVPRFAGDRMLVQVGASDRATEYFLVDLASGESTRLTDFGDGLPDDLVVPETVWFTAADGVEISGLLYRPRSAAGPVPAVLTIHGGPEWAALPVHDPLIQRLVRAGIAVLAPNVRGSTGRGLAYQRLIYRDWGGGDLADFDAAAQFLRSLDWVDGDRLGVHGMSYGGFAALSCLTRLPQHWRAGVAICGPADLVSDVRALPPTWSRRVVEWIGDVDDPEDLARLKEASPLTHAADVRAPLLLAHAEGDTTVVINGTEQLYETLTDLGKTVRFIRLSRGHLPDDREERDELDAAFVQWFRDHLEPRPDDAKTTTEHQ